MQQLLLRRSRLTVPIVPPSEHDEASTQRKQEIMGEEVDDTLPAYFVPAMLTAVLSPEDAAAQAAQEAAAVKRWEDLGLSDYK